MGTISGVLSTFSPHFFTSGTNIFQEQGWWKLTYPKLTPNVTFQLCKLIPFLIECLFRLLFSLDNKFLATKLQNKEKNLAQDEASIMKELINSYNFPSEFLIQTTSIQTTFTEQISENGTNSLSNVSKTNFLCI